MQPLSCVSRRKTSNLTTLQTVKTQTTTSGTSKKKISPLAMGGQCQTTAGRIRSVMEGLPRCSSSTTIPLTRSPCSTCLPSWGSPARQRSTRSRRRSWCARASNLGSPCTHYSYLTTRCPRRTAWLSRRTSSATPSSTSLAW